LPDSNKYDSVPVEIRKHFPHYAMPGGKLGANIHSGKDCTDPAMAENVLLGFFYVVQSFVYE
jgi:hypothetical protein